MKTQKTQKTHFKIIFAVLLSLKVLALSAMVDLELTQGVAQAIPLAIELQSADDTIVPGNQSVREVMRNDLEHSGEFRVASRHAGADYAVTGSVQSLGAQRYKIHVELRELASSGQPMFDADFTASQAALRAAVHRIDDEIYKRLTGVRGIFSTRIAYVVVQQLSPKTRRYSLEVADADGFNPRVLLSSPEPIMSPAWTPDGHDLAYVSFEGHRAAIYRQNIATGQRQLISQAPGINGAPSFSPEGRYMALVLSKTGNPNLYLLDLQNHQLRALTQGWSIDTEPRFSPDGQHLLFTSNRDGNPQVYEYALNSGKIQRVSYSGNYNARPSYVPLTQDVIMMHRADRLFGIARLNRASGDMQTLIQTGADESPSVSPNGKLVIYATQYAGRGVLAQISMDGRIKLRLPAEQGSVQEPAWSPFLN